MANTNWAPSFVSGGMQHADNVANEQRTLDTTNEQQLVQTAVQRQAVAEKIASLPTRTKKGLLEVQKLEEEVEAKSFDNDNKEAKYKLETEGKILDNVNKEIDAEQSLLDFKLDKDLKRRERVTKIMKDLADTKTSGQEGDLYSAQAGELGKPAVNEIQKANIKNEQSIDQLERTLTMIEANPNAIGVVAETKSGLYAMGKLIQQVIPGSGIADGMMDKLGDAMQIGDIEAVRANVTAATSALLPIASGGDTRYTDFDVKRAEQLNIAAKRLTSVEQAAPVLREMIQILRNGAKVQKLMDSTRIGTVTALKDQGLVAQIDGIMIEAPVIDGTYLPLIEIPDADTPEVRQALSQAPIGAKFIVVDENGKRLIKVKKAQRKTQ